MMARKFCGVTAFSAIAVVIGMVLTRTALSLGLEGCTFDYNSEYAAFNTQACSFSTVYRCPHGTLSELTCTNAEVKEIHQATQAFVENGGTRLNLYLMWATFEARLGTAPIILNRDSFSPRAGALIQTVYLYMDTPSAILEPSLFEIFPILKSLQLELLHPIRANTTVELRNFSGYLKLNAQLEYLLINTANEAMSIDKGTLANLPALKCLKLIGAKFKCDCAMQEFMADLSSRVPSPLQGDYSNHAVHPLVTHDCGATYAFCDAETSFQGEVVIASPEALHVQDLHLPNCSPSQPEIVPYPVRLTSTCSSETITFNLEGSLPSATYTILGFFDEADPKCQATPGSQSITTSPGSCGTSVHKDLDGTLLFKGTVLLSLLHPDSVGHLSGHPDVEPLEKVAYSLTCTAQQRTSHRKNEKALGEKVESQITLTIPSTDFPVGRYAFEVSVPGKPGDAEELRVQSCWATYANDSNSIKKYEIIQEGCIVDPSAAMEKRQGVDRLNYRYSFVPFKFRGEKTGSIFIHCTVRKCATPDDGSSCSNSNAECKDVHIPTGRQSAGTISRHRRDIFQREVVQPVQTGRLTVFS